MTKFIASRLHLSLIGSLGVALAACDEPAEPEQIESRTYQGSSFKHASECPPWECGFNSAEVNGRSIRELNLDGLANSSGVRIVGFLAPAGLLGDFELAVEDDELVAIDELHDKKLRGAQLIGATILVKEPGLLGLTLPILVLGYDEVHPWASNGADVPSYALVYPDLKSLTGSRNVCNTGVFDLLATNAVVLGGETYDLDDKTVNPDMDRWLTIACAGSAASKLRLMNYGPQSDFDGEGNPASAEQRQATLKMLTADYCGDGTSYTANGTPLAWENAEGTVQTATQTGSLEAVWTADGALCLEATRLADAQVDCGLPTCESLGLDDGEWVTHLPKQ